MATTVSTKKTGCPSNLCERHYQELLSSGISQSIIAKNFRTINDAREIDELLNRNTDKRTKHSDHLVPCWAVTGIDPEGWERHVLGVQVKPDFPEVGKDGKPKKYLGATDCEAAPLFLETDDPHYWHKVYEDLSIPLFITEGAKKAAAALSILLACISIPGVSTCRKLGRLHEKLKLFCKFGRTVYLGFDNDVMQKQSVQMSLLSMGRDIAALGAKVMVIQLPPGDAKGMDDYIAQHGEEEFKKLVDSALTIEEWKKQLQDNWEREKISKDDSKPKSQKYPPADEFATELAEQYKDKFLYNNEQKTWMDYEHKIKGQWTAVDDIVIECHIQTLLKARGITGYGTDAYIQNICKFLRRELVVFNWNERQGILPFEDGIVDIVMNKFEEHCPGNRLTWCLPRRYNSPEISDWSVIRDWLKEATGGNESDFKKLTHFAAAVLRGRSDLQKFLYLWGDGGSGKGTYTGLLKAVVGERNSWSGKVESLDDLNQAARLVNKKLAIFPDQDKVIGKLQTFKNLTGGDDISAKLLYKEPFNFVFKGLGLLTANSATLRGGGVGRWFQRRAVIIAMNNMPAKVRDLEKEFAPEIAAFTKYLLTITDEEINTVLRDDNLGETDPNFWVLATRGDSLASWVNEHIIFEPGAKTRVGDDKGEWSGRDYDPKVSTLFGSHNRYCIQGNLQPRGINNFSPELEEILRKVLRHPEVRRGRDKHGNYFEGVRLRTPMDYDIKLHSEVSTLPTNVGSNGDGVYRGVDQVTTQLLTSNPCGDEGVDLLPEKSVENFEKSQTQENLENPQKNETIEILVTAGTSGIHHAQHHEKSEHQAPVHQQIKTLWDNTFALGQLILVLAEKGQLAPLVSEFTPEQIKHIKEAANAAWKPGCNSYGDYNDEKVELFEFGNTGRWKVRLSTGGIISVSRTQVYPWLDLE